MRPFEAVPDVITDGKGVARYSQVGFKEGGEKTFRGILENPLADKAVTAETTERRRLRVGETVPAVKLPSIISGTRESRAPVTTRISRILLGCRSGGLGR